MPRLSPDANEVSPALTLFSIVVRHIAHWAIAWPRANSVNKEVATSRCIIISIAYLLNTV